MYKCSLCDYACDKFAEAIDHMIIKHPDDELRIRKQVGKDTAKTIVWQTKNFQVIPSVIKANGCFIYCEPTKEIIKIAKLTDMDEFPGLSNTNSCQEGLIDTPDKIKNLHSDESPFKSPVSKRLKFTSTPIKYSQSKRLCSGKPNEDEDQCIEDIEQELSREFSDMSIEEINEDTEDTSDISYLVSLIPDVLANLATNNQKDTFIKFNKMVAEGTFPMTNIAYLLFLDIVEWFSTESTTQMRYSDETKKYSGVLA